MNIQVLKSLFITFICLLFSQFSYAQFLPEQDCFNAIPLCSNLYSTQISYSGEGNLPTEINPLISCLGAGEQNDAWFIFTVTAPGNLNFTITPNNPLDDYDWAVYNLTGFSCSDIFTNAALQVSCNFNLTPGPTGANGGVGAQFNPTIPVLLGQTYVVNVSNYTGSAAGFTIDFGASTATIFDNVPPVYQAVTAPACGSDTLNIQFSENVLCSSVSASDFNIVGPAGSGPFTVTSVTSINCAAGGTFDNVYTITVSPALIGTAAACFAIQLVGPVQDNCGNVSIPTSLNYCIVPLSITASAAPASICVGQSTVLSTSLSGVPGLTFTWTPGNPSPIVGANPSVSPTTNTTYNVVAQNAAGCTANASVTVPVIPPLNVIVYASPATLCAGQTTTLSTNYTYVPNTITAWDPGGFGGQTLNITPGGTTTFTATVTNSIGCSGVGTVLVTVNPVPTATFTVTSNAVCENVPVTVTYTGSASAGSGFVWDFDGGTVAPANPTGPGPYTVTWNTSGPKTITLQINDKGCLSAVYSQTIQVNQVPSAVFSYPTSFCENACNQIVYQGNATSQALYNWDFDGGVLCSPALGQGPYTLSWTIPGTYNVCLSVTENGCTSPLNCQNVDVFPNPVSCIAAVGDSCLGTSCYNFSYCGTPNVDAYYWSMPTAIPSTANNPNPLCVHYNNAGPQTVWMYVMDNGCLSDTSFINFNVIADPVANFMASSGSACEGNCMSFTYTGPSVSPLQSYQWNFGPSASPQFSSSDTIPCVTFHTPGFATVQLIVCNEYCCDTMTQQIFVNPSPNVSAGPDKAFCKGDGPIQLDGSLTPGQGIPTFTYSWWCNNAPACGINMVGTQTPMVNPGISPTTYYFQATDGNGCKSNIDSTLVIIKEKPIVDAGLDQNRCGSPSSPGVSLSANVINGVPGPYTYSWFCNSNSGNCGGLPGWDTLQTTYVFPDTTTIFTVVVTAANGCSSDVNTLDTTSTMTVTVIPVPKVEAGPYKNICKGDVYQMLGYATGAGPNYTYSWTPSDIQAGLTAPTNPNTNASPLLTTLYTLSATSNGCTGTDTVTINVHTLPTSSINPPVDDMCQGDSVVVQGLANGDPTGTIYSYHWSHNPLGSTSGISSPNSAVTWLHPTTTTTFNLQISSAYCSGFADAITITVRPTPIANIVTNDTTICMGDSIKLIANYSFVGTNPANPVIFNWTPDYNMSNDTILLPIIYPTQTTVYTLTTSVAGTCPTSDKVTISVAPFMPVVASADTTTICTNGVAHLHAEGGILNPFYAWTPVSSMNDSTLQDPTVNPDSTTTYYVTVTEAGCSGTDSVKINVHTTPKADYFASNTQGCDAMDVSFFETSTNELSYIWNFGDGTAVSNDPNPSHTYMQAGSYPVSLTVIGQGGCRDSATLKTVVISSNTFAAFTSNPLVGDSLFLPSGASVAFIDTSFEAVSWLWDFGDNHTSTEQNPVHVYTLSGNYPVTLTVTNKNGCTSTISNEPYIVVNPNLFAPNTFTPNEDGVHDTWVINYLGTEKVEVAVYDRWGRAVFQNIGTERSWNGNDMKGKKCTEGTYYYSISIGKKVYNGYLLIVR